MARCHGQFAHACPGDKGALVAGAFPALGPRHLCNCSLDQRQKGTLSVCNSRWSLVLRFAFPMLRIARLSTRILLRQFNQVLISAQSTYMEGPKTLDATFIPVNVCTQSAGLKARAGALDRVTLRAVQLEEVELQSWLADQLMHPVCSNRFWGLVCVML